MTILNYPSLVGAPNIQAFFRLCRSGESWNDDAHPGSEYDERAFRVRYGGWDPVARRYLPSKFFDSFDDHPRIFELTPTGEKSSAAGALQITATTWDDMRTRYPGFGPRFGPWDQYACGVALIWSEGALDDVLAGRVVEAIRKCGNRWASLPGSTLDDGGSKLALEKALATWKRWGGHVPTVVAETITQEPAPIEDHSIQARPEDIERINAAESPHYIAAEPQSEESPMAPLIVGLLTSLASVFTPLVQAKVTKALDKQTGDASMSAQMAAQLMEIVKQAAGQVIPGGVAPAVAAPVVDPVEAVAVVKRDPMLVAKVEQQINTFLDQMAPVLDRMERMEQAAWVASEDSMDRAAARAAPGPDDWMAKALVIGILVTSGVLIALVSGVAITQIALLDSRTPTTEVWAALTGIIGTTLGILGTVYAFKFGSTRQSQTKDFAIAELSTRRKA